MEEQYEVVAEVRGEERRVWIDRTHAIKVNNDFLEAEMQNPPPVTTFNRVDAALVAAHVRSLNVAAVIVRPV